MSEIATRVGMPLDQFLEAYNESPFELIDGERIPLMPNLSLHGEIIKFLVKLLFPFEAKDIIILYFEQTFILEDVSNWVKGSRVPDIMVYTAERMAQYKANTPDWAEKPFVIIPDLCIEVVSPTDKVTDIEDKVAHYLADGVRVVWVVNAHNHYISVHTAGGRAERLTIDEMLDGGALIPGFVLPLRDLFTR